MGPIVINLLLIDPRAEFRKSLQSGTLSHFLKPYRYVKLYDNQFFPLDLFHSA